MSEKWLPIESAPKDGTILIRSRAGYIATAEWMLHGWALVDSFVDDDSFGGPYYLVDDWKPVEWRPSPPPGSET